MGQGGTYKCNKCGYELNAWTGVGYIYPTVCKETTEQAKKGELGEELKKFFEEHPDGKINCEKVLVRCEDCGEYDVVMNLSMYIPKEGKAPNDAIWDLDGYKKLASYKHTCTACGGKMKTVKENEEGFYDLTCPECGEALEMGERILWD